MEMTALMQALVKDLAEQMKPLINEQIAVWAKDNLLPSLSNMEDNLGQKIQEHFNDNLAGVAKHLTGGQLDHIARHVNLESLAAELAEVFTEDIAGHISLSDLASEINLPDLANELDMEESIKSFFGDHSFTISP